MIGVLVEGMLPPALADDPYQRDLARMHVRIAVVGWCGYSAPKLASMRSGIARPLIRKYAGLVRLGRDIQTAARRAGRAAPKGRTCTCACCG